MKKYLIIIVLGILIGTQASHAQALQVGIKGVVSSTWLINNNVSDAAASVETYVASFGQSYGLSGAIYFTKKLGVEANFFYATHRQKYTNEDETYESETELNQINIPLLLKLRSKTGTYIEIGVAYNALTSAKFSFEADSLVLPFTVLIEDEDIKPTMAKSSFDAVLGIGVDINLFAGLSLTAALRFAYSMTDLKGVDAFGQDMSNTTWLALFYDGEYEQTRAASGGFLIGLTYSLGKLAGD